MPRVMSWIRYVSTCVHRRKSEHGAAPRASEHGVHGHAKVSTCAFLLNPPHLSSSEDDLSSRKSCILHITTYCSLLRTTSRHKKVTCCTSPPTAARSLTFTFSCDRLGCLLLVPTSASWPPSTPGWWAWSWRSPGRTSASRHADSCEPRLCGHPDNTYRPLCPRGRRQRGQPSRPGGRCLCPSLQHGQKGEKEGRQRETWQSCLWAG